MHHYIYHGVPPKMTGNHIVPLSELETIDPALSAQERSKYAGREDLLRAVIHPLGCFWNEAVFLNPVHPAELRRVRAEEGIGSLPSEFFKIDAATLDPALATVWLYATDNKTEADFVPFRLEELWRYAEVPVRAVMHYRAKLAVRQQPLMFAYIPHILYKGKIDVTNVERIVA